MSNKLKYTSSIKDMPLMFSEMKRTALLLCEGRTTNEILQLSMEQNIYQLEKEKRRRDVPVRMIKRLSNISHSLVSVIAHGNDNDAKLIVFLALMKSDLLLFEYMREIYVDKFQAGYDTVSDKDFTDFIDRKAQNSKIVAKWSTKSLASIRSTIKNVLCDAGLAKKTGGGFLIQKPIVYDDFSQLIDEEDKIYAAQAMLII